jgi:hypothetical protein
MKFLKGMSLGLLGFLLLASLFVLGAAVTLNFTLLNPGFIKSEVKQIDLQAVAQSVLKNQLPADMQPYLNNLGTLVPQIKPWLDSQSGYVIDSGYRYLKDSSAQLNIAVETGSIKPIVIKWATGTYISTLTPAQTQSADIGLISQQITQALNSVWPSTININADTLGGDTMRVLAQVKKGIEIWQTTFYLICVLTALWIVSILVILRKIKDISRMLGIIFSIQGVLGVPLFYILLNLPKNIFVAAAPDALRTWLTKVLNDLVTPWGIYSACLLIAGVVMLVATFYLRKQAGNPTFKTVS